jgi:hypothetical protein
MGARRTYAGDSGWAAGSDPPAWRRPRECPPGRPRSRSVPRAAGRNDPPLGGSTHSGCPVGDRHRRACRGSPGTTDAANLPMLARSSTTSERPDRGSSGSSSRRRTWRDGIGWSAARRSALIRRTPGCEGPTSVPGDDPWQPARSWQWRIDFGTHVAGHVGGASRLIRVSSDVERVHEPVVRPDRELWLGARDSAMADVSSALSELVLPDQHRTSRGRSRDRRRTCGLELAGATLQEASPVGPARARAPPAFDGGPQGWLVGGVAGRALGDRPGCVRGHRQGRGTSAGRG